MVFAFDRSIFCEKQRASNDFISLKGPINGFLSILYLPLEPIGGLR
jgi:hypothetical protein